MKTFIITAILAMAGFASAQAPAVLWTCNMTATDLRGIDAAFIYRGTVLEGKAQISCRNALNGKVETQNVYLALATVGVGPQIAIPLFNKTVIKMGQISVGLADPKQMFGEFSLGRGFSLQLLDNQAQLGVDLTVSFVNKLGIGGNVSFALIKGGSVGFGAQVYVQGMLIMNQQQYNERQKEIERKAKELEKWRNEVFNRSQG